MNSQLRDLNGRLVQGADVDNGTANATVAATAGVEHHLAEIIADYSIAPAAGFKTITIILGATTVAVIRWNPALEMPFRLPLQADIHAGFNEQLRVELQASGTPGTLGRVAIVTYDR